MRRMHLRDTLIHMMMAAGISIASIGCNPFAVPEGGFSYEGDGTTETAPFDSGAGDGATTTRDSGPGDTRDGRAETTDGTVSDADAADAVDAPPIELVTPTDGALVSGSTPLEAEVRSRTNVRRVAFRVGGDALERVETSPYRVDWQTDQISDGSVNVEVVLETADGATHRDRIGVIVDNTPPDVQLVSPSSGSTHHGTITLEATATDETSSIAEVAFSLDGGKRTATVEREPYRTEIDASSPSRLASGEHEIRVTSSRS